MKILLVGATGTIGRAVMKALSVRHDVIPAHRSGGYRVDLSSADSIKALYEKAGMIDAVVCAAGAAKLGSFEVLTEADYQFSVTNKLMGQINLVRLGLKHVLDGGSFTLTSGILSRAPVKGSAAISMVNGAIEAFGRAAALELPRGIRINVVSPGWVAETLQAMGRDPSQGMPASDVARTYVESVQSTRTGEILDPALAR